MKTATTTTTTTTPAHALASPRGFFSVRARYGKSHVVARALCAGAYWCHRAPLAGERPVRSAIFIPCQSMSAAQSLADQFQLAGFNCTVKPGSKCAVWSKASPMAAIAPAWTCKVELAQDETVAVARSALSCVKCSLKMAASMGAR